MRSAIHSFGLLVAVAIGAGATVSCSGGGTPGDSDGGVSRDGGGLDGGGTCGLGPLAQATSGGLEPCLMIHSMCPAAAPASYRPLYSVKTCGFSTRKGQTDCAPVDGGICVASQVNLHFSLVDPAGGCTSMQPGTVDLRTDPLRPLVVEWSLDEASDEPACNPASTTTRSGTLVFPSVCCAAQVDIAMPRHQFVFRVAVQLDWQP